MWSHRMLPSGKQTSIAPQARSFFQPGPMHRSAERERHMTARYARAITLGLAVACATAAAQAPPDLTMTPMEPPAEMQGALPLYPGVAPGSENDKQKEKWARVGTDYLARNV